MHSPNLARVALFLPALLFANTTGLQAAPEVGPPPESFFALVRERDREAARAFYAKHVEVQGLSIAAAAIVVDQALVRAHEIVSRMLAGRPDILQAMVESGMYLVIIGQDQVYTDMPEYRNHPNPEYQNERVRGTGGKPTSFGEENLLSLPLDRYDDESIAVHEFCHTIDGTLRSVDRTWRERRSRAFENAREKGLYENAYAGGNAGEYWAEIAQAYFDCQRVNNWNHGPIGTREQLKAYDPEGYELCRSVFALSPEQDWRYVWLQALPNVTAPPAKLGIDSYYTKFTWAREFTVLGREASDESLLKANHTIRQLFAYRHDILKALIAEGLKLVVLARDESIADLPEYRMLDDEARTTVDPLARYLEYSPDLKLLAVAEENLSANPRDAKVGDNQVIRVFAHALHQVAGRRPVDPEWENRPRNLRQQYELRVKRLDAEFDERLASLFDAAIDDGRWKGTSSVHDRSAYWTTGVLAYFDAAGQDAAPIDARHPIDSRELLREYDPELFALVHETMAYAGRVDWRFRAR